MLFRKAQFGNVNFSLIALSKKNPKKTATLVFPPSTFKYFKVQSEVDVNPSHSQTY